MLIAADHITGIFVVAVIIILIREFVVSGLREFLGAKDIKVPVTSLAKWKTAIQMIATGVLIVGPFIPGGQLVGLAGLSVAAVLTVMTGWAYLKASWEHIKP